MSRIVETKTLITRLNLGLDYRRCHLLDYSNIWVPTVGSQRTVYQCAPRQNIHMPTVPDNKSSKSLIESTFWLFVRVRVTVSSILAPSDGGAKESLPLCPLLLNFAHSREERRKGISRALRSGSSPNLSHSL